MVMERVICPFCTGIAHRVKDSEIEQHGMIEYACKGCGEEFVMPRMEYQEAPDGE